MGKFTEREKLLLIMLFEGYEWIARDEDGHLYIYTERPEKHNGEWDYVGWLDGHWVGGLSEMFDFVDGDDAEPTLIADVLK